MFGASKSGSAALPSDPDFEYVTLLLDGNGTNGGQNNTFVDSSTNNFTITRNGNTTQGSFSPYGDLWSNYFNGGSTTYLNTTTSSAWDFGSGAFTLEAFINVSAFIVNSGQSNVDDWIVAGYTGSVFPWVFRVGTSVSSADNKRLVFSYNDFATTLIGNTDLTEGVWTHVVVACNGSTVSLFQNGTRVATASISGITTTSGASRAYIGGTLNFARAFNGYISNVRVVKGTDVYGATNTSITVPTSPFTAITNTQLLTCQSNRFIDNSSNAFAITVNSVPTVQRFSPFEPSAPYSTSVIGGSGYFDGSGDYLTASDNALIFGTNDFSIEWFEYRDALTAEGTPIRIGTGNSWESQLAYQGGTYPEFYVSTNGSSWNVFNAATAEKIYAKEWNHFVFTRSGTAFRVFQNGKLVLYATGSGSLYQASTNTIRIMAALAFAGYITNVRVVNGSIPTTYQTSSTTTGTAIFTSPTAPLTTTSQGATSGDVKLIVNAVNASIFDYAMMNNLETVGNAQVSTSVKKFGTGSLAFDGNGDVLSIPYRPMFNFSGDFTIECWLYVNSLASIGTVWSQNSGGTYFILHTNPSGGNNLGLYIDTLGASPAIASSSISTGVWYHVALTRAGSSFKLFLNGTQTGSTYTNSGNPTPSGTPSFFIGNNNASNGAPLNGYVDDFRITNGLARYTANFTAPTAPFPIY